MRTNGPDPHRILGLAPGATAAEVKRAYRALAKRHHPDASQGSATRFLEIQAAYEALIGSAPPGAGGPPRRGRQPAQPGWTGSATPGSRGTGPSRGSASGAPPGSDWARRPGGSGARPGTTAAAGTTGAAGTAREAPRGGGSSEQNDAQAGATRPRGGRTEPGGGRTAGRRRATLGSTSYDEAEDVFEPDWHGATWYGTSSGTYWTVNPREYADPRKHGPEYQARGRRPAAGAASAGRGAHRGTSSGSGTGAAPRSGTGNGSGTATGAGAGYDSGAATGSGASPGASPGAPGGRSRPSDLPPAWRPHPWTAASPPGDGPPTFEHDHTPGGPAVRDGTSPRAPQGGPVRDAAADPAPPASPPSSTRPPGPGIPVRVALAVLGWGVPGLAVAALAGFPGGFTATLPLQVGIVAFLAAAPRLAWAAAGAGLAVVFAAIPIVALVAALGGPVVPGEPMPAAAGLAVLAWVGGLIAVGSGRVAPFPWRPGG